ncbi:MAG: sigma-70 family RNA polymerase sigma factor [Chitinophagaceae bacterium]|nr:sigma-70 family RNA polymerase sigma factor [Chitinophagaceae bacterium]
MVYSDDELLQLFNDGTERGFNGVFEKFWLKVYNYVLRMGISKDDAKDVTVDTFVKLFNRRKTFEQLTNILAYLNTVARNTAIDLINERTNTGQLTEDLDDLQDDDGEAASYNEEVTQETLRAVLDEIDKLPNQCRTIFILAFLHEKTNAEIAAQLNIVEKTVRNQKHKARQHLRMTIPLKNWLKSWMLSLVA